MISFRGPLRDIAIWLIIIASFATSALAEECTIILSDSTCIPGQSCGGDRMICERHSDGRFLLLSLSDDLKQLLDLMMVNRQAYSGSSVLEYTSGELNESTWVLTPAALRIQDNTRRRKLAQTTGNAYVLVVKAIDSGGNQIGDTIDEISDNWFGTHGDAVNVKSQMAACSGGDFNIIPGYNPATISPQTKAAYDAIASATAPGVIEVNFGINIKTSGLNRIFVAQHILMAVSTMLQLPPSNFPGPFDHIALVVEGCYTADCGWGAWANLDHWLSVYQDWYYLSARTQMHEIGHNFGFEHSSEAGSASRESDHTCTMGNPLYGDDEGRMCFNPAKSFWTNWYTVDTVSSFDLLLGLEWTGVLMGAGEWEDYPSGVIPVIVRIDTSEDDDYFVGFNRAAGANLDNVHGDDAVTVTKADGQQIYSLSTRVFMGYTGESYYIPNFEGSGRDLTITVNGIDITGSPGLANVTISLPSMPTTPSPAAPPVTDAPTIFRGDPVTPQPTPSPDSGANGDPIILGLQNQVFKFLGRDGAWYSNVSNKYLRWNMQFRKFDSCPEEENMFISGMTLTTLDERTRKGTYSDVLIVATPEPTPECQNDPNLVCLGEGTLHISFDGGETFLNTPGDYTYGSRNRVVAHNTYAACSRKWHDYEISDTTNWRNVRDGGRRVTVQAKKPLSLLADRTAMMIDPAECNDWIEERVRKNDLFQQRGLWSTIYVETPMVSFHVEYRRSDWYARKCDFQSLDAWMTNVDGAMDKTEWHGILGETKHKIYDLTTGEQVKTDRYKLLRGQDDADYEVKGPFDTQFAAMHMKKTGGVNRAISSVIEKIEKNIFPKIG